MYNVENAKKYLSAIDAAYNFINKIGKHPEFTLSTDDLHYSTSIALDIMYSQKPDVSLKMIYIPFYNDWFEDSPLNFVLIKNITDGANISLLDYENPTPLRISFRNTVLNKYPYQLYYKSIRSVNRRILNNYITLTYDRK